MRKAIAIAALAAAVCLLGGCDFFRVLAGRPTSAEIEAKRAQMAKALEEELPREAPVPADSLSLSDSLVRAAEEQPLQKQEPSSRQTQGQQAHSGTLLSTRTLQTVERSGLQYRYYLMIGAFRNSDFADRQAAKAEKAGYPATLIPFKNGFTAVGVSPTDDLNVAWATLDRLRKEPFCPRDAWILNNE